MRRCSLNLTLSSLHLLLFSLFIFSLTTSSYTSAQLDPLQDIVCALINCGNGECKASNASLLGFDCECNPGWKKIQIGPLTFPSCLVPNCTLDLECGNGSPPPPPPPPPVAPPPLNLSNPCGLVWCGEGTCMTNGTAYSCQCYEGAANLMDLTGLPCFNECSFGADCNGLGFGNKQASPPPPVSSGASGNDIVCALINCGNGECKASNASLLGFDCECSPGWKKIQIGPLTFPSCLVPNCTLDLECGNGSPPPPPVAPPPLNLSNPCGLVWCGEGTCMTNGTAYSCQCYEGAANLMNLTGLPCFNECSFGADCNGHGFGNKQASPPPPVPSGASGNGLPEVVPNCSRKLCALTMIMLAAIFLTWV